MAQLKSIERDRHLWFIHGKAYDLSEFMHRHPGGCRAMEVSRGRDCTELFESYHSLTDKPRAIMEKFCVGVQENYNPMFKWGPKEHPFQSELREEVRKYFKEAKVDSKVSTKRLIQLFLALIFIFLFTIKFYWMDLTTPWWALFVTPILWWTVMVNSFHDASHYALSRNQTITTFFQYIYPYFTSPTTWDHQHIIAHHVYTNIHKLDPDLNHGLPVFRMHPHFRWKFIYNFQLILVWVVWSVATFWLATIYDYQGVISGKYHGVLPYQQMSRIRMVEHIFGRFASFYTLFGIPYLFGHSKWDCFVMGLTFNILFSICFMITTQVNHFCEELMFHRESKKISECWSIHQINTAQDFAHDSLFWWIFAGALNFQIEHHLFPGVNHEHLPNIKPIIVNLCKKYNIPYNYEPTYFDVLRKYLSLIRDLSNKYVVGSYERSEHLKNSNKVKS